MENLLSSYNMLQLRLKSFHVPNAPPNCLVKVEVYLVDIQCHIWEENFRITQTCSTENGRLCFESEVKELTSARVELDDLAFVKLPNVERVSEYSKVNLFFVVKLGTTSLDLNTNSVFRSKINVMDAWHSSP